MPPNNSTIPKYLIITHIHMQAVMRRERARGRHRDERKTPIVCIFDDLQHQTKWRQMRNNNNGQMNAVEVPLYLYTKLCYKVTKYINIIYATPINLFFFLSLIHNNLAKLLVPFQFSLIIVANIRNWHTNIQNIVLDSLFFYYEYY